MRTLKGFIFLGLSTYFGSWIIVLAMGFFMSIRTFSNLFSLTPIVALLMLVLVAFFAKESKKYLEDELVKWSKEKSNVRNIIKKLLIPLTVVIAVILFFFSFFSMQHHLLFHPYHDARLHEKIYNNSRFEEIRINNGENEYLYGWFKHNEHRDEPAPVVIFFGGNAQSASSTMWHFEAFIYQYFKEYNFIMVDYPGYGLSAGRPSDRAMFEAAITIYDYVVNMPNVDENNIVLMGNSIGSGVAIHLASRRDVTGLILIAPYDRGINLYNSVLNIFHGPLTGLVRYRFDVANCAKSVDASPLIIASYDDEIINYQLSKNLVEYFDDVYKLVMLNNVGHNFMLTNRDTLEAIQSYLDHLLN
ncbi:MAG: alpha/beta fold hydrolase [Oscillospiraceae bacterium]|nr:alpha/beta fold hydrolase [Oscillospiraceae bacterium]